MRINNTDIRQILIVNLGGIGDVLLSTPALRALRHHYPQARIVFLGVGRTRGIAKNIKYFNEVHSLDIYDDKIRRFSWSKGVAAVKILLKLRREGFDLTVNMRTLVSRPSAFKMALLFYVLRGRVKAGRDTNKRGFFFDVKIPESDIGDTHEMDYDLATAKALGADISDRSFDKDLFENKAVLLESLLRAEGVLEGDKVIVVNPGGAPSHRWPLEHFITVTKILSEKLSCKIIITGALSETDIAASLKQHSGRGVIDLSGKLDLGELASLLSRARLFITNDSGPMHIGAILQVPMVALFGPGYLKRFDPRVISPKAVVFVQEVACAPCNRTECASLICLRGIAPKDIAAAAEKLWKEVD